MSVIIAHLQYLRENTNFKKQTNNKPKIVNINAEIIEKVRIFGGVCEKGNQTNKLLRVRLIQTFAPKNE